MAMIASVKSFLRYHDVVTYYMFDTTICKKMELIYTEFELSLWRNFLCSLETWLVQETIRRVFLVTSCETIKVRNEEVSAWIDNWRLTMKCE